MTSNDVETSSNLTPETAFVEMLEGTDAAMLSTRLLSELKQEKGKEQATNS